MPSKLTITLLGKFSVVAAGRSVDDSAWKSRKAQQLVKLLALTPHHRMTSDQVFDALWPQDDPEDRGAALRQICYLARRALGDPALLTVRGGVIALAPNDTCQTDVATFEFAAAKAQRTRATADLVMALDCYRGELLPDERYADWAILPAEHLRGVALDLRRELATLYETAGDDDAALVLWQRILSDDPAEESAHIGLMRYYARRGERQRAVRQYHQLHERLQHDLAIAPNPTTQRLYAAILSGQYPPVTAPKPDRPQSAPLPPHSLPTRLTTLIGREAEIAAVAALLNEPGRLLTLTGAGGCGKTRLALAVAEAILPAFSGGAWWVDLAPLTDGKLIIATTAQTLGIRPAPGQTARDALVATLRERSALIILDNAEHLREDSGAVALSLLSECPALRILVTSRSALRIDGEQSWRVPSLPLPADPTTDDALATLSTNEAVRLFVTRSRLVQADFALTVANGGAVATICRYLDGMPLALELAAARIGLLDPRQIAARLDNSLGLLASNLHGTPSRQRTIRATLDWSYSLLTPAEQILLARLAIFTDGWTLDAAEAIGPTVESDLLADLAGLVEHSLIQVEAGDEDEEPRYRLLEPTREYALAKLDASGITAAAREAHAAYFLAFAEKAEPRLEGATRVLWLGRVRRETGNLRGALGWLAQQHQTARALCLAAALRPFWRQQEYIREGWGWLQELLPTSEGTEATLVEARACLALAELAGTLGNWAEGSTYGARSLRLFTRLDNLLGQARALSNLAMNQRYHGQIAAAKQSLERAIDLFECVGDRHWILTSRLHLGVLAFDSGDMAEAKAQITATLPELRKGGDTRILAVSLLNLATYSLTMRETAGVGALLAESLALALAIDEQGVVACILAELADLAALEGCHEHAARLLGASQSLHRRAGLPIIHSEQPFHDRAEAAARAALGDSVYEAAYQIGTTLTPFEAADRAGHSSPSPN